MVIRTAGNPLEVVPHVRDLVRSIDSDQPISGIKSMDDVVKASMGQRRVSMMLLTLFAGFALLIACIGLYGITAYAVTQRTREIGVRMALGAETGSVIRLVLGGSMRLAAAGAILGLLAAMAITRVLRSMLYGVGAADPLTFAAVALLVTIIAMVASYVPARRALRVDPADALRAD
jgi:putative ABC transport system permease protein